MKEKFSLFVDLSGRGHLINPALVADITCTGGTDSTRGKNQAVVEIVLAGGKCVHVTGFGDDEADALENVQIQLAGDAGPHGGQS